MKILLATVLIIAGQVPISNTPLQDNESLISDVSGVWKGSDGLSVNFLFVGRLTQLKGLQDILKIAPSEFLEA